RNLNLQTSGVGSLARRILKKSVSARASSRFQITACSLSGAEPSAQRVRKSSPKARHFIPASCCESAAPHAGPAKVDEGSTISVYTISVLLGCAKSHLEL